MMVAMLFGRIYSVMAQEDINGLADENGVPALQSLTGTSLNDITQQYIRARDLAVVRRDILEPNPFLWLLERNAAAAQCGAVGSSSTPEMPKGLNGPAGPSVPITEWIPVQAMKEPEAFDTHSYICASAERVVVNGMPLNSKDEQIGYWRERYMAEKLRSAALQQEENPMWAQYLAAKRRITELEVVAGLVEGLWAENARLLGYFRAGVAHHNHGNTSGHLIWWPDKMPIPVFNADETSTIEVDLLKAQLAAFTASSPPASDTPLPERRPDGTLKPASKPWSAPVPNGDHRRVGG